MKTQIDIPLSPHDIAEAFWNMNDADQAEMFAHLWSISEAEKADGLFVQALYIKSAEGMESDAAKAIMALAAPFYIHTLRFCGEDWWK